MLDICDKLLPDPARRAMAEKVPALRERARGMTAFRIEATLREFPPFPPMNLWFDHPVHRVDESGALADVDPDGQDNSFRQKGADAKKKKAEEDMEKGVNKVMIAIDALGGLGTVTKPGLVAHLLRENVGTSENMIGKWIKAAGFKGEGTRPWLLIKV